MLLAAERPVISVGQGVRYGGAAEELKRLAERLQIPVAASASGLGALDCNHPLALGSGGIGISKQLHTFLEKNQAEILASRQWDERRLAYPDAAGRCRARSS